MVSILDENKKTGNVNLRNVGYLKRGTAFGVSPDSRDWKLEPYIRISAWPINHVVQANFLLLTS